MNNNIKQSNFVSIIGIGGAGMNVISSINKQNNLYRVAINEESDRTKQILADLVVELNSETDKSDISALKEKDIENLNSIINEKSVVIICAGLGGETGTQMTPVISKFAKQKGAKVVTILFKPFNFEGTSRMQKAVDGANEIKSLCDRSIIISNEKLRSYASGGTFRHVFSAADDAIKKCVATICDNLDKNASDGTFYSQLDEVVNTFGFVEK